MEVHVEILAGRRELRQAMAATRGKMLPFNCRPLSEKGVRKAILSRHGSLDRYIFHVVAKVPDRVHTHLRTHNLINRFYQCSSSRPDLEHSTDGSMRVVDFNLPAKRLLEMAELRLCTGEGIVWPETLKFMEELKKKISNIEPAFQGLLQPECVYKGFCNNGKCRFYRHNMLIRKEIIKEAEFYAKGE